MTTQLAYVDGNIYSKDRRMHSEDQARPKTRADTKKTWEVLVARVHISEHEVRTLGTNFSSIALRQISTNSGRSNQFSEVDRSMTLVDLTILSDTASLIFGMIDSTLAQPRRDKLCVRFPTFDFFSMA